MARLHRPHIPFSVRVEVAERQFDEMFGGLITSSTRLIREAGSLRDRLAYALNLLFGDRPYALDHHPALVNRKRYVRNGKTFYRPAANDPAHLTYREAGPGSDHDIKTRVRGDGAQRSDLAQRRYDKNVAKNRAKGTALKVTAVRTGRLRVGDKITYPDGHEGRVHFVPKPKRKLGSRPIQSRGFR